MQPAVVRCVGRGLRTSPSSPCPQLIKWRRRGELGGMEFAKLIPKGSTAFTPETLRDLLRQHYAERQLGELAGAAVEEEDGQCGTAGRHAAAAAECRRARHMSVSASTVTSVLAPAVPRGTPRSVRGIRRAIRL
jgi:hypothetical protein